MNLDEIYNKIEELYIFLYDMDIDNLSDSDRQILKKSIKMCNNIVDDYEHLSEHID